jgi:hypothetical protein
MIYPRSRVTQLQSRALSSWTSVNEDIMLLTFIRLGYFGIWLPRIFYVSACWTPYLKSFLIDLLAIRWGSSSEWISFNHQLGPLARESLAFFFAVVPVVVAIWDYYGFLVCCDGLYFFLDDILSQEWTDL